MTFLEAGRGDPLVLVHGFLGGARQWREQIRAFSPRCRVVAPDLPGFGDSAQTPPVPSIPKMAELLLQFLDQLNISRFFLLGHSMGGMLAQEMASQAPQRTAALILCGTGARGAMPGRFETIAESRARAGKDGAHAAAARIAASWLTNGEKSPHFAGLFEIARLAGLPAHLAGLDAMEQWSGIDRLPRVAAPTLVVWSSRDRSYPFKQAEELWRNIPEADLAVIPGAAHAAPLEKPEIFNAIVGDFLREGTERRRFELSFG